jgi:hypothetical protein
MGKGHPPQGRITMARPISSGPTVSWTVAENAATGTSVGITANAALGNGNTRFTYSLSQGADAFAIDPRTGAVTVKDGTLLDYETATSQSITVKATAGGVTSSNTYTVVLTDVSDQPWIGTNEDDVLHTDGLNGAFDFDGREGNDTLVIDSANPRAGESPLGIDLGWPYGNRISGSQLDGSTITNIENVTVNNAPLFDSVSVRASVNNNVITVNGPGTNTTGDYNAPGYSGTVLGGDGNDIINIGGFHSIIVSGDAGDDIINLGTSYTRSHVTQHQGTGFGSFQGLGDDAINLGSGQDYVVVSAANGILDRVGNDTVNNFTPGVDVLQVISGGYGSPPPTVETDDGYTVVGTGENTVTIDATGLTWTLHDTYWWNLS